MNSQNPISLKPNFEEIKHNIDQKEEFWYARELMPLLGYDTWRNFEKVIDKAKKSLEKTYQHSNDHFVEISKMIKVAGGTNKEASREITDYKLSRYACYLIAQNGDPTKEAVAQAQSYFAHQTRKQELQDDKNKNLQRIRAREKLRDTERKFSGVLKDHGVTEKGIAQIRAAGDEALFNNTTQDMKNKLGVKTYKPLADHLPTITLKAKDLATEMTTFNTREKTLIGTDQIKVEHIHNNEDVRRLLTENGIYPERLPAEEDISRIEKKLGNDKLSKLSGGEPLSEIKEMTINIVELTDEIKLKRLSEIIKDNPGETNLNILFGSYHSLKKIIRKVNLTAELMQYLRRYII